MNSVLLNRYFQIIEEHGLQTANLFIDLNLQSLQILSLISLEDSWNLLVDSNIGVIIFNDNPQLHSKIRSSIDFNPTKVIFPKSEKSIIISAFEVRNDEFKLLFEVPPSLFWKLV